MKTRDRLRPGSLEGCLNAESPPGPHRTTLPGLRFSRACPLPEVGKSAGVLRDGCSIHWDRGHLLGKRAQTSCAFHRRVEALWGSEHINVSWRKFPSMPSPIPFLPQTRELLRLFPKYLFVRKMHSRLRGVPKPFCTWVLAQMAHGLLSSLVCI